MDSATVYTANDIKEKGPIADHPRRKYSSKACTSCRKLKIRCRELSSSSSGSSCEHCVKLGRTCSWPEEDARRRSMKSKQKSFQPLTQISSDQANPALPDIREMGDTSTQWSERSGSFPPNLITESPSSEIPHTVLQYYRYLGTTAIVPGHKKVSLKVIKDFQASNVPAEEAFDQLFDSQTGLPRSDLVPPLLDAFFEYYGNIFCFLNREQLGNSAKRNDISSFLLCSIAALSARFCPPAIFKPYFPSLPDGQHRKPWEYCLPFLRQAKRLMLPLISIPSCDLVAGLLFLALAEFGDNDEAGK